jgi:hypothetical protein
VPEQRNLRKQEPDVNQQHDEIRQALFALINRTEALSKQVLALINLNALLVREVCIIQDAPLDHFAKIEAEVGGLGEAIAMGTRLFTDIPVSSQSITEVFEQVLRQGRALVENANAEGEL